jgi:molybdate transport system substrate-binding protein
MDRHRSPGEAVTESLTILSSMATRAILRQLVDAGVAQVGAPVALRAVGGVEALRLARAGEPVDVIVLARSAIEQLVLEGHVAQNGVSNLARSDVAVAVKAGTKRPDIRNEDTLRRAILAARKVGYSTGPSGDYIRTLWVRWGVAAEMAERSLQAPPGMLVATYLASGEVDLGFQQLAELLGQPGVDIIGPLPPDCQYVTTFAAGVAAASRNAELAMRLVNALSSAESYETIRRLGMEPA